MKIGLKPQITSYELEYYLDRRNEKLIENTKIYELAEKLTKQATPSYQDKYEKRWENFYLPIKREGKRISVPLFVLEYNREFFIGIHQQGNIHIKKGRKKTDGIYAKILKETIRFIPLIRKSNNQILKQSVPYDLRTGKIKGKYILEKVLSKRKKEKILKEYEKHLEKNLLTEKISLNEYLNTAAICYRAAFGKKAELTPCEMYKKWADGRDGGMLSIKKKNSRKEFTNWLESGASAGAHPFEIIFSWHRHGIHLYPPSKEANFYTPTLTNYAYAPKFIKIIETLSKLQIPFRAKELEKALDYLTGESYFTVNEHDEHCFFYMPSKEHKKKYFKHIEWDEIKALKWKKSHCENSLEGGKESVSNELHSE